MTQHEMNCKILKADSQKVLIYLLLNLMLVLYSEYGPCWWIFHVQNMYSPGVRRRMSWVFVPVEWSFFVSFIFLLNFCKCVWYFIKRKVKVWNYRCAFSHFIKFYKNWLIVYWKSLKCTRIRLTTSLWRVDSLIIMQCYFLSLVILLWMSTLTFILSFS